jgi:hypothetical protein
MSFFQRLGRKTVDAVKEAASKTTQEELEERIDIATEIVKLLAICGVSIAVIHSASRHVVMPTVPVDIPQVAAPTMVIKLVVGGGDNA